jgi:hypothetical protein
MVCVALIVVLVEVSGKSKMTFDKMITFADLYAGLSQCSCPITAQQPMRDQRKTLHTSATWAVLSHRLFLNSDMREAQIWSLA